MAETPPEDQAAPARRAGRGGLLRRHPGFRMLALADTVSQAGSQIGLIALPLVALLVLGATPAQLGVLTALQTAGFLLVGLPSGVWVDRMRKLPVMIVCDVVRAAGLGSVPLAAVFDALTLGQLYVVAFATGIATVFFEVAYQSYLPFLVGRTQLVEGNTILAVIRSAAEVAGPGAGGWLVRLLTGPVAVLADAVSFLGSAAFLIFIRQREPRPSRAGRRGLWAEMKEGLSFVLRHALLRPIVASAALGNLCVMAFLAVEPVFFIRTLAVDAGTYGTVLAASAVGGVLGAMTTTRQARLFGQARMLWMNALLGGCFFLLIPLAEPGPRLALAVVGGFGDAFFVAALAVAMVSFRQGLCPPELLGRVNATARFLNWGVMPAGGLLGGILAQTIGVRESIWVCGAGFLVSALPVLASPLRRMRDLPATAPQG